MLDKWQIVLYFYCMKIYIYTLSDPETNEIRYVGKSGNPNKRFKTHLYNSKRIKGYIHNWIKSLLKKNQLPILSIIEECNENNWEEREIYWIKKLREDGFDLVNIADGGNQPVAKKSQKKYSKNKSNKSYRVRCGYNNKVYNLGSFNTIAEAENAYDSFHENPKKAITRININNHKTCGILMLDLNDNLLMEFDKIKDCAEHIKTHSSNIVRCCRGKAKTHKGYKFKYKEE